MSKTPRPGSQHKALYGTARWKAIRALHLRQSPICVYCGRAATVADHVEPHKGDLTKFYEGALQSLCKPCHDSSKKAEEARGEPIGCDVNGNPLAGWKA